jgi:hypothetical protein
MDAEAKPTTLLLRWRRYVTEQSFMPMLSAYLFGRQDGSGTNNANL